MGNRGKGSERERERERKRKERGKRRVRGEKEWERKRQGRGGRRGKVVFGQEEGSRSWKHVHSHRLLSALAIRIIWSFCFYPLTT